MIIILKLYYSKYMTPFILRINSLQIYSFKRAQCDIYTFGFLDMIKAFDYFQFNVAHFKYCK